MSHNASTCSVVNDLKTLEVLCEQQIHAGLRAGHHLAIFNPQKETITRVLEAVRCCATAITSGNGNGDSANESRQVGSRIAGELTCSICSEVMIHPVVTTCGHVYCERCLSRWRRSHRMAQRNRCPNCRTHLGTSEDIEEAIPLDVVIKCFTSSASLCSEEMKASWMSERKSRRQAMGDTGGSQASVRSRSSSPRAIVLESDDDEVYILADVNADHHDDSDESDSESDTDGGSSFSHSSDSSSSDDSDNIPFPEVYDFTPYLDDLTSSDSEDGDMLFPAGGRVVMRIGDAFASDYDSDDYDY